MVTICYYSIQNFIRILLAAYSNPALEPEDLPVKMINVTPTQYRNMPNDSYEFERDSADFQNLENHSETLSMPRKRRSIELKMAKLGELNFSLTTHNFYLLSNFFIFYFCN